MGTARREALPGAKSEGTARRAILFGTHESVEFFHVPSGRLSRSERILLSALAALSLLLRALAFFRYRFDSDEPQHLHVAWGWTAGLVQYRDLFDNHAPLFHILSAPLLRALGERPDVLLYMRAPMLPLAALVLFATYLLARKMYSQRVALWSVVLLSLFPPFLLKSVEYRTDNLWNALWAAVILILITGELGATRTFVLGLLLGIALSVSLKTVLLVATLGGAAAIVAFFERGRRNEHFDLVLFLKRVVTGALGFCLVPAILLLWFRAAGAWKQMVYCVVEFNEKITHTRDASLGHLFYLPALAIVLFLCWRYRPLTNDPAARWRFFFASAFAIFATTLGGFWVLISPRDMLPIMPLAAIFAVAAAAHSRHFVPIMLVLVILCCSYDFKYTEGFRDATSEQITMMRQVLGLTRRGEPLMDLKGETIYRPRPFYYIFELITRAEMEHGLLADTIPESMVAARCHVAQADGTFFPARGRAFLNENFLDLGRLRASGQWLRSDGSFSVAIPGEYLILGAHGPVAGTLDGQPHDAARTLMPGVHRFRSAGPEQRLACLWAPAYTRGYSPFHLRDRDY